MKRPLKSDNSCGSICVEIHESRPLVQVTANSSLAVQPRVNIKRGFLSLSRIIVHVVFFASYFKVGYIRSKGLTVFSFPRPSGYLWVKSSGIEAENAYEGLSF